MPSKGNVLGHAQRVCPTSGRLIQDRDFGSTPESWNGWHD